MELDITYHPAEDRIRLLVHRPERPSEWWLTRRVALRLLQAWANKLEAVPLPPQPVTPWTPAGGPGTLAQQHALLMDAEAPRVERARPITAAAPADGTRLVHTVKLAVSQTGCQLSLVAPSNSVQLRLSRQQAHTLLEALAHAVHQGGWLEANGMPDWLGYAETAPPAPHA